MNKKSHSFTPEDKARIASKQAIKHEGEIQPKTLAAKVQHIVDSWLAQAKEQKKTGKQGQKEN